jgi:hypothetical protein
MIQLPSPADLLAVIERDRLASIEWRTHLVAQANANAALEGFTPDAQVRDMQQRFIAGELDIDGMLQLVRDLAEKAGTKLPDPTPHDMGLD